MPTTFEEWARRLAVHLGAVISAMDPDGEDTDMDAAIDAAITDIDRFEIWRIEQRGQQRIQFNDEKTT